MIKFDHDKAVKSGNSEKANLKEDAIGLCQDNHLLTKVVETWC